MRAIQQRRLQGRALNEALSTYQCIWAQVSGPVPRHTAQQTAMPMIGFLGNTAPGSFNRAVLVASLARPGGNLTGVSILTVELMPKQLDLMTEVVPQASAIGLLVNPTNANVVRVVGDTQKAADPGCVSLR